MATMQSTERLIRQMLDLHPRKQAREVDDAALVDCIEACVEGEQVCTACADASLAEPDVAELVKCIRLCLDCTGVCEVTRQIATRQTEMDLDLCRAQLMTCARACRTCAAECQRHASHHEHCRVCAETCRRCEDACNRLLQAA
jgi:uncharacterized protein DUF326